MFIRIRGQKSRLMLMQQNMRFLMKTLNTTCVLAISVKQDDYNWLFFIIKIKPIWWNFQTISFLFIPRYLKQCYSNFICHELWSLAIVMSTYVIAIWLKWKEKKINGINWWIKPGNLHFAWRYHICSHKD